MKYKAKNGTIIVIPDAATPQQIAQIKQRADKGYTQEAQKIATGVKQQIQATRPAQTPAVPAGATAQQAAKIQADLAAGKTKAAAERVAKIPAAPVSTGDPAADAAAKEAADKAAADKAAADAAAAAAAAAAADAAKKKEADAGTAGTGDTYTAADDYLEGLIKNMKGLDLSGAPGLLSDGDIKAHLQSVYDSNFQLQTQGVEEQRARDLEAKKQELAQRGIPYNPDESGSDLYAAGVRGVNQRFDTINSNAAAAANSAAMTDLGTYVAANKTQNDQYTQNKKDEFNSQLDAMSGVGSIIQSLIQKFGYDEAHWKAVLEAKTAKQVAKINQQGSGGGGGSSGGGGDDGFGLPGVGGEVY